MMATQDSNKKTIVVVGAGLAGLVSSLTLQRAGHQVVLVEKRSAVGGLCGTFFLEGHEFVIACNDFGSGLVELLESLGVNLAFEHKESRVWYRGQWYDAAPSIQTLSKLRSEWPQLLSLLWGILLQQLPWRQSRSMEDFANRYAGKGAVNDFTKLIAYFMGVIPDDIKTSYFKLDSQYGYGYTKMACPTGGPQALSDAVLDAFLQSGGELLLNACFDRCAQSAGKFRVTLSTAQGIQEKQVDQLIDTRECKTLYPAATKRGLPLSMMCLVIRDQCVYPKDTHTLTYYEPGVSDWFGKLDQGKKPTKYGFHLFKSDLVQQQPGCYSANLYFYLPRGIEQLDDSERRAYSKELLDKLENMLPGVADNLVYSRIITPQEFEAIHGLSSRVTPFIHHGPKPTNQASQDGYYHAGHTVYPPGEHAGAAALSGHLVAKSILKQLAI